jgi:anaerobic carbon-monoxide dehydrogenase iron sulfur subunit
MTDQPTKTTKILTFNPTLCKGCKECEQACSNVHFKTKEGGHHSAIHIITKDNTYEMHVCNQCGLCIDLCPTASLTRNKNQTVLLNTKTCIGCQACVAFCPTQNMNKAPDHIQPFKCIACGACAKACPTHALTLETHPLDRIILTVHHKQGA